MDNKESIPVNSDKKLGEEPIIYEQYIDTSGIQVDKILHHDPEEI
jgi:hypothetical protein